jgi:hypothetical protein
MDDQEIPTKRVVRVTGEFSLLPQYPGEDVKTLRARLLLDTRFQLAHYLDAHGVEQTATGSAADVASVLEQAGYVVKSRAATN